MNTCDRYETEGLALLEQGLELPEHFTSCQDCRRAAEQYQQLQKGLSTLHDDVRPSVGWQSKVLHQVETSSPTTPEVAVSGSGSVLFSRHWPTVAAMAATLTVAAIYLVNRQNALAPLDAQFLVRDGGTIYRGQSAKPGDTLAINALGSVGRFAEVRLYRDGRIENSCSTEPPCKLARKQLEASFEMDARGEYRAIVFNSNTPLPESNGLDSDVISASDAGAKTSIGGVIVVR